ncbi:MAG: hypothetical protein OHK0046_16690 [Anaerolineae bacterium]
MLALAASVIYAEDDDNDNNTTLGEFNLLLPATLSTFDDVEDLTAFSWEVSTGANAYEFGFERIGRDDGEDFSGNAVVVLTDDDDDDDDDKDDEDEDDDHQHGFEVVLAAEEICDDATCTYTPSPEVRNILIGGKYKWEVTALATRPVDDDDEDDENGDGVPVISLATDDDDDDENENEEDYDSRRASNAPFYFYIQRDRDDNANQPGPFVLISPSNGAVLRDPLGLTEVVWSSAEGAVTYKFELKRIRQNSEEIAELTLDAAAICDPLICRLPVSGELTAQLTDGTYRWKVFATNGERVRPARNSPSFFVVDTDNSVLPGTINWIAPTGILTDTIGNPLYVWEPYEGATRYEFYMARTNFLREPVFYRVLSAAEICDSTACSFDLTNYAQFGFNWLTNGLYTIYIRPNNGEWSGPFEFGLNSPQPTTVTLLEPLTSTGRPTIQWTLEGDAIYSAWFRIYVAPESALAFPAYDRWVDRREACGSPESVECAISVDLPNGTYNAYVQNWGPGGFASGGILNSGFVGPVVLTVEITPPNLPTDLTVVSTSPLTLSWTGDINSTWYQIWVGAPDFSSTYTFEWMPANELDCLGGGTCTLTLDAPPAGTYVWYVQTWGPGGLAEGGLFGWVAGPQFTIPTS